MKTIIGTDATPENLFKCMDGWTSKFTINGKDVGGAVDLYNDERLKWQIETIGGVKDRTILELGPLEGAHTKAFVDSGADYVFAVEGISDCFLRCLIVKEAFNWDNVSFIFADFNSFIQDSILHGDKFGAVCANGVLYHQENPALLIANLAKITDTVMVWSQVAGDNYPAALGSATNANSSYSGRWNTYGEINTGYCGGLNKRAFWLYLDEMIRCFTEAGFTKITQKEVQPTINGQAIMFVATKK